MPAIEIFPKFRAGTLHSGSPHGPIVTNPSQARAIEMSYARKEGAKIPKKKKKFSGVAHAFVKSVVSEVKSAKVNAMRKLKHA